MPVSIHEIVDPFSSKEVSCEELQKATAGNPGRIDDVVVIGVTH